jgi:Asp-tRNA(Asn)/Glu-tRNA(Gln) amidotransferase A subunit family amidase
METDADLVRALQRAGGIVFVKSNMPQLFWIETDNFIYGKGMNPWDPARTPGGSSGGDGGLVASRCAALGIGTDIGGSIRVPSHFNGLYGYKPTPERMPHRGMILPSKHLMEWNRAAMPVIPGPLAKCVDDCVVFLDAIAQPGTWTDDPYINPLPFNRDVYEATVNSRALKIGYYYDDGIAGYSECTKNLILDVKARLEARGHTVVPIELPNLKDVGKTFL